MSLRPKILSTTFLFRVDDIPKLRRRHNEVMAEEATYGTLGGDRIAVDTGNQGKGPFQFICSRKA